MLLKFFKKFFKMPKQIVSDNSPALLAASLAVKHLKVKLTDEVKFYWKVEDIYIVLYPFRCAIHFVKHVIASKCFNASEVLTLE